MNQHQGLPILGHVHKNGDFCAETNPDPSTLWPIDVTDHAAATEQLAQAHAENARLLERVAVLGGALELIASPMRPDGTWNRDRLACQQLAGDVLAKQTGG